MVEVAIIVKRFKKYYRNIVKQVESKLGKEIGRPIMMEGWGLILQMLDFSFLIHACSGLDI